MSVLVAGTGVLIDDAATTAGVEALRDSLRTGYQPTTLQGSTVLTLTGAPGTLRSVERTVTVRRAGQLLFETQTAALVYRSSGHRVTALGRAIVTGQAGRARFDRLPGLVRVVRTEGTSFLTLSVVLLDSDVESDLSTEQRLEISIAARHERRALEAGSYTIAIETKTASAWKAALTEAGNRVTVADPDGDGIPSVIVDVDPVEGGVLVVHYVEVSRHG
ncbi:MAG: hypothetical protein ABEJ27_07145 [Halodesulfurarchaeum sp.]